MPTPKDVPDDENKAEDRDRKEEVHEQLAAHGAVNQLHGAEPVRVLRRTAKSKASS